MNAVLSVTIVTVGLAATLAAGQAKYPPPFPRDGTVKLLENDRVIIWDNTWKKDVLYPLHEHTRDMTGVFLQWGPIRLGRPDGTFGAVNNTPFDVPSTFETQKGVIHSEQNIGDPERRGIMVELKDPNPAPLTPPAGVTLSFPRASAKQAHDGPRSTIWDYVYQPGAPVATHFHDKDTIVVIIGGGTLRIAPQGGTPETRALKHGEVRYIARGQTDVEEAVGAPVRAMIIELK
jgi:hypothetical protein